MSTEFQKSIVERITSYEDFYKVLNSGMFWEYFPECDGTYQDFFEKYKQKEGEINE